MRVLLGMLLTLIVSCVPAHWALAQSETGVRLVVLTGDDRPVAGLTLTLVDDVGTSHPLFTDAKGVAEVLALPGSFFRITTAQWADGTVVSIDTTTLDAGLRLGLVPDQTRTVLLRLDANLLFVDPDTIFAGTDAQQTIATAEALAGGGAAHGAMQSGAPTSVDTAAQTTVVQPVAAPPRPSRWPFVIAMAGILLIPLSLFVVRALLQAHRQGRRGT